MGVSNNLDSDLVPNCLQRLSADDICKQRAKFGVVFRKGKLIPLENSVCVFSTKDPA